MNGVVIKSENKNDLKLFADLAKRLGIQIKYLSDEELLDLGLLKAMEEGRTSELVPKARILEKLKNNGN